MTTHDGPYHHESHEADGCLFWTVRCDGSPEILNVEGAVERLNEQHAEIERLRGENACLREATRWRKVEEELPSSTGWHLVRYQNDEMGQSWYRNGHGNWVDRQGKSQYPHYWQPLPEPPKEAM